MADKEGGVLDSRREEIHTVVIGGGQAGLATAYHLKRRGIPFVVLDAHSRVGDSWRKRWDSLQLVTPARYSGLPGMPFPAPPNHYPTKDEVADYLEDYATRFDIPFRHGAEIDSLRRADDRFEVSFDDEVLLAENVVVATGPYHHPRIPGFASELDNDIVQLHSKEYRNPGQLRDGGVLVVGAGNSGAEIAVEVARDHQTWLSGRDTGQEPTRAGTLPDRLVVPVMWFMATRVLTLSNPIGRKVRDHFLDPPRGVPLGLVRRKDIKAAGIERVARTAGARDGKPALEDGRVHEVSNVIWATGFEPDFGWIDIPLPSHNRVPLHDRGVVDACPGLYIVGLLFQYSLSSALVGGVGRDAEHVVAHLASSRADGRERAVGRAR